MFQQIKTKWSYLAGMIDGEGCISIWRTYSRAHDFAASGKTYGSFNLRIQIYNTSLALMKWLVVNFGGTYSIRTLDTERHKDSYSWRPKGENNTKQLLLGILPYLVIKHEQAKLALEYISLPRNCPEKREPLYQRIRELNRKGKPPTTSQESAPADKIEPELYGDIQSDPVVTQDS